MAQKKGAGNKPQKYDKENGQYTGEGSGSAGNGNDEAAKTTSDGFGRPHIATPAETKRLKELGIHQSGAISGALDADGPDGERAQRHADMMYETFRNITSDVPKIAAITGHTEQEISRIKNHMFFNEYELYGGKRRFYPDFEQAQSWDRLRKGEALYHDFIMIEHELIEEKLMREEGLPYNEAHEKANQTASYELAIKEHKGGMVNKKRN